MPFKANADRRHRIPNQRRRVTNWAEYDAALRQRGSLTVWFTEAAITAWHAEPRTTPGGQPHLYGAFGVKLYIDVALLLFREMSCIPVQRPAPITPPHQVMLALDWLRLIVTIGGKLARGRGFSRRNLVSGRSTWDRNHDAAMRIGSEAPRGGPNLLVGIEAMWGNGTPPPRTVIGGPSRVSDERPNPFHECAGSDRRT